MAMIKQYELHFAGSFFSERQVRPLADRNHLILQAASFHIGSKNELTVRKGLNGCFKGEIRETCRSCWTRAVSAVPGSTLCNGLDISYREES